MLQAIAAATLVRPHQAVTLPLKTQLGPDAEEGFALLDLVSFLKP